MSVRRRCVQNRVAHDLQRERSSHEGTKALLRTALDAADMALRQRDRYLEALRELLGVTEHGSNEGPVFEARVTAYAAIKNVPRRDRVTVSENEAGS